MVHSYTNLLYRLKKNCRHFFRHITSILSPNTCLARRCRPLCGLPCETTLNPPAALRCAAGYTLNARFAG